MRIILIYILVSLITKVYAQDLLAIDTIQIKCSYEYSYLADTTSIRQGKYHKDILHLQIGSKYSKCFSYYSYQCDSIRVYSSLEGAYNRIIREADAKGWSKRKLYNSLPRYRMKTTVYKNYPVGAMTATDHILKDYYQYEDSINLQEWDIYCDSTKTILEYECQMATCRFRGREWTAWFALEIPISDGPWKLMGLPGLIMEAYDKGGQHWFCINGIQKVDSEPLFLGTDGKDFDIYQKVKRTALLKSQYEYHRNPKAFTEMSSGISFGDSQIIHKYDLLEREER